MTRSHDQLKSAVKRSVLFKSIITDAMAIMEARSISDAEGYLTIEIGKNPDLLEDETIRNFYNDLKREYDFPDEAEIAL